LREALAPLGAWVWDGQGENPYFGMLGLADAVIVTADSVSMVSEAVATSAPVYLVRLPGRSSRIGAFMDMMAADGRVRDFAGRLDLWDCAPMDDTPAAGDALRRLMGD
jgi:mitochondrial fission protein ELM1